MTIHWVIPFVHNRKTTDRRNKLVVDSVSENRKGKNRQRQLTEWVLGLENGIQGHSEMGHWAEFTRWLPRTAWQGLCRKESSRGRSRGASPTASRGYWRLHSEGVARLLVLRLEAGMWVEQDKWHHQYSLGRRLTSQMRTCGPRCLLARGFTGGVSVDAW